MHLTLEARANDALSPQALVDKLITLLFGGYDTTFIALSYGLFLFWKHPDAQDRVLVEACKVLPKGECDGPDPLAHMHVNRPEVHDRSFQRGNAALPTNTSYCSAHHLTHSVLDMGPSKGTVEVPADVLVYMPAWWVHRPELNWDRPNEFDPSKFFAGV